MGKSPLLSIAMLFMACTLAVGDHHKQGSDKKEGSGIKEGSGHKQAAEAKWFDLENCAVCKPMHENQELMHSMLWESHRLEDGMMMTAEIPAEKQEEFASCCKMMKQVAETAGPDTPMCGFCASLGAIKKAGARVQEINTGFGKVTLVTSDNLELVKMIQEHADKTQEAMDEMAKMAATN